MHTRGKLTATFSVSIVIVFLIGSLSTYLSTNKLVKELLRTQVEQEASYVRIIAENSDPFNLTTALLKAKDVNPYLLDIVVLNPSVGSVIAGSYDHVSPEDQAIVKNVFESQRTTVFTNSSTEENVYKVVMPVLLNGKSAILLIIGQYNLVLDVLDQQLTSQLILVVVIMTIATLLGYRLSGIFYRSIKQTTQLIKQASKGEIHHKNQIKQAAVDSPILDEMLIENLSELSNSVQGYTEELQRLSKQSEEQFLQTVMALSKAVDARDPYTHSHSRNVALYSYAIARKLGFREEECFNMYLAGLLHDIGKIATPEHILNKQGPLTSAELKIIQHHAEAGFHIVNQVDKLCEKGIDRIVLCHHERLDGKGYPLGLSGDEIPLGAQILAVSDSFDAMTTTRSYRKAMNQDEAIKRLKDGKGSLYNPDVISAFIELVQDPANFRVPISIPRGEGRDEHIV